MNRRLVFYSLMLILVVGLQSCIQMASEVKNWLEAKNIEEVVGAYHYLDDDGIKIYLPEVFKKYSAVEYQQVLDSLITDKDYEYETSRLRSMREMEGNMYIYFDDESRSTYTINTMPYTPLYKQDAQYILGMIRMGQERITKNTDLTYTKLTAKYNASAGPQIFKAIYRIDNAKTEVSVYNTTYIISSNNKTVFINLTTPFDVYFDPFLQKMIF